MILTLGQARNGNRADDTDAFDADRKPPPAST